MSLGQAHYGHGWTDIRSRGIYIYAAPAQSVVFPRRGEERSRGRHGQPSFFSFASSFPLSPLRLETRPHYQNQRFDGPNAFSDAVDGDGVIVVVVVVVIINHACPYILSWLRFLSSIVVRSALIDACSSNIYPVFDIGMCRICRHKSVLPLFHPFFSAGYGPTLTVECSSCQ